MKKRIYEYDIVRSITTIAVIMIHISAMAVSEYTQGTFLSIGMILFNRLLKFVIIVFIYLSGAMIYEVYKDKKLKVRKFYGSRISKILLPYIVVSIVYHLFSAYLGNQILNVKVLMEQLVTGSAQYHLYFIPIIMQLYLLTPLLWWLKKKINVHVILLICLFVNVYSLLFLNIPYGDRVFLKFIFPFVFGMYYGSEFKSKLANAGKKSFLIILFCFSIGVSYGLMFTPVGGLLNNDWVSKYTILAWFSYGFLMCLVLIYLGSYLSENTSVQLLSSWLSKLSFTIYLIHPMAITVMVLVMKKFGVNSVSLKFVLLTVSVGFLSIGTANMLYYLKDKLRNFFLF